MANNDHNYEAYTLWDTWQLAYAFSRDWRFGLTNGADGGGYWNVFTAVQAGTSTHKLSTDTIWYCIDENSVMVDIIGVNY